MGFKPAPSGSSNPQAWAAGTAYTAGQLAIDPIGRLVQAKTTHTSGTVFSPGNWTDLATALRGSLRPVNPLRFISRSTLLLDNQGTSGVPQSTLGTSHIQPERFFRDIDGSGYLLYNSVGAAQRPCLASASSPYGPFTDLGGVTGITGGDAPDIFRLGSTWYMLVGGTIASDLSLYKSTTGPNGSYTLVTSALIARGATGSGAFDEGRVTEAFYFRKPDGTHVIVYMGLNVAGTKEQVGFATCPTGSNVELPASWTKFGAGTFTANTNSTTTLASVSSFASITVGSPISGAGIPAGTTVASVNTAGNSLVMSAAATATATGVTVTSQGLNPIIANGTDFDSDYVADPFVFTVGDIDYIFYCAGPANAFNTSARTFVGVSYTTDWVNFTKLGKFADNPPWPAPDSNGIWRGSFYSVDDTTVLWHRGGAFAPRSGGVAGATYKSQVYLDVIDLASLLNGPRKPRWIKIDAGAADARMTETGTWANSASASFFGGNARSSQTAASRWRFDFKGVAVRVSGGVQSNAGIYNVYLDGQLKLSNVDGYLAFNNYAVPLLAEFTNLEPTEHRIEIEATGNKNAAATAAWVFVDYVEFIPSN